MPATILVGTQWGDEGKGKVTDLIAGDFDMVVRCSGGNNAGHTVIVGDMKLALHLMPSGVMYPHCTPVIGNGCVIDPGVLVKEMAMLRAAGIDCESLKISCDAHVIMPYHKVLDGADEKRLGKNRIGTTKRGIGPCYQDKAARRGIRMQDLLDEKIFKLKLDNVLQRLNLILEKVYGLQTFSVDEIFEEYSDYAKILGKHVTESAQFVNDALRDGKNILFEGAQGTMLDIDHGTYPFVTSSSCCSGGACTGAGVGPTKIDSVIGVMKAYTTRVGEGPFPTELLSEDDGGSEWDEIDADILCDVGHEYGTTTGRKRRCGWFDAVVGRYAADIHGLTEIALTKLDVLSEFEKIKVCTAYEYDGKTYEYFPMQQSVLFHARPLYTELEGWREQDISGCKSFDDLPDTAKAYVEFIEKQVGVRVSIISTGPDRDQTIHR